MRSPSEIADAGRAAARDTVLRMIALLRFPEDRFPVALDDWNQYWPHTNREQCMLAFVEEVTVEENWAAKVFDEASIKRWKADVMDQDWQGQFKIRHGDFSEAMFTCCIEELQEKAKLYQDTGIVPILDVEARLARSDTAIPFELKTAFQRAAVSIERTSAHQTDWRPINERKSPRNSKGSSSDSANLVVNLIDPAMYPLINGRSRVLLDHSIRFDDCLSHITKGFTAPRGGFSDELFQPRPRPSFVPRCKVSQWLPCEVRFPDGQHAKIMSYVNNLHPKDRADVYPLLERIITKAMPLWNLVYCTIYKDTMRCDMRIVCDEICRKLSDQAPDGLLNMYEDVMNGLVDDVDDDDDYEDEGEWIDEDEWQERIRPEQERMRRRLEAQKVVIKPEPGTGEDRYRSQEDELPTPEAIADFTTMLGGAESIQVVVKLRAMYPTPDHPVCDMGSYFALDGAWNDHVAATAVYFFDDDNVTDARISFQAKFNFKDFGSAFIWSEDSKNAQLDEVFGFKRGQPPLQNIGSATMREGLLLAYPNVLLHKESSFRLKDPTRPGHRKVLTLHLVDPRVRVLSTANVPPQQADWWAREFTTGGGQLKGLPKEVVDMIVDNVTGFPIRRDEALRLREERVLASRSKVDTVVRTLMNYGHIVRLED